MKTASHFREDNQAGWVTGGGNQSVPKTLSAVLIKGVRLAAALCALSTASATPGPEGELRAILAEAMRENDAIRTERAEISAENGKLSAAIIDLRAAQSRTLTALGETQARADQLASEAERNLASATKTGEAYRAAVIEAAELHSRLWWWIRAACGLGLAIAGYVALRLWPVTRLFVP